MSRIDELIAKHCPAGVEFFSIGDVAETVAGLSGKTKADFAGGSARFVSYKNAFANLAVDQRAPDFVVVRPGEKQNRLRQGDVVITGSSESFDEVGLSSVVTSEPIEPLYLNSFCFALRLNDPKILLPDFSKYLFRSEAIRKQIKATANGVTRINVSKGRFLKVRIPVPPLDVQHEIIRVLDQFTQLETELKAELEARRSQYEFYRARILNPGQGWRSTTIGEIAEVFDGPHATPKKTSAGPWYLSISSLKDGNIDLSASAHLAEEDLPKWTRRVAPRSGDTLFSYETRIGQAAYWDRSEPAALGRRMGILRPRTSTIVPKFLTIAFLSPDFQAVIASKTVRGSTVDRILIADLANWPIAVPSVEEQQRIIALLDKFDALVNDCTVGLPAALAARRKQYDYYSEQLLAFEEAVV